MRISVIIPNYNGKKLLEKNLGLVVDRSRNAEIIVVDDCSEDDSVEFLKAKFPGIKVIGKDKNEGFAGTVNCAVKEAKGDLIYLLNSDVVPAEKYLENITPYFQDHHVFAVGSLQKSEEKEGVILRGRGIGSFQKGFLIHARGEVNKNDTLWVSGGAGMFRKRLWEKLGGMNTLYNPFYWEDIDLSYRALKAGYRIFFESKSVVVHRQNEGIIRNKFTVSQIRTIAYRNQIIFIWLNISNLTYLLGNMTYLIYDLIKYAVLGDFEFIQGYFSAILMIPKIIISRLNNKKNWRKNDQELLSGVFY